MAIYKENIVDIDLSNGNIHRSFLAHSIGTADNLANRFGIRVYRNGAEVDLTGVSCQGYFRDPAGNNIALTSNGTVSGNTAYVTLPQACYNYEGQFNLSIKLVGGGITGTMRIVDGVVDNTHTGGAVAPTETVPTYQEVLAVYEQAAEAVEELEGFMFSMTEDTINLWDNPLYDANGVTVTQNGDGSIHVQGTPTQETLFIDQYYDSALTQADYMLSCRKSGTLTGGKRFFVCTRNETNTGTKFITFSEGMEYGEVDLTSFAPYRCEIVLFSDTTYNCDLYIQLERGTESTAYIPPKTAIDYKARNQISEIMSEESNVNELLADTRNYVDILEINEKSKIERWGLSSGVVEHIGKTVHYSLATASNGGFYTEEFTSDDFVLQITQLSFDMTVTAGSVRIWMYGKTKSGGDYASVIMYPTAGHHDLAIDFAYYDVYSTLDISKPIRFLITNGGEEVSDFTISNLVLKSLVTSGKYAEKYKEAKVYELLDNIAGMIPTINEQTYIKSPDGNKWLLTISNTGELGAIKITPNKSAFIGNSLLMGWATFGMAASDNEHDYYYHITNRIHELDNTATYSHMSNGNLEHSTNQTDFNTAFNAIKPYLTSDLDLICIQLGDNVNTSAKITQFEKTGGSFDTMVGWIRENCPNTRLIWVGTWYPSIHDWLVNACKSKGVEFVDILPLSTASNKAQLGDIIHRTEDHEQTLTGTYTASGGALNCTLTMYGGTYSVTIPSYTSVTNNGDGTFTVTGPYTVIDSTGVMSHPNDDGMKAIADTIMEQLGIM